MVTAIRIGSSVHSPIRNYIRVSYRGLGDTLLVASLVWSFRQGFIGRPKKSNNTRVKKQRCWSTNTKMHVKFAYKDVAKEGVCKRGHTKQAHSSCSTSFRAKAILPNGQIPYNNHCLLKESSTLTGSYPLCIVKWPNIWYSLTTLSYPLKCIIKKKMREVGTVGGWGTQESCTD